jgi:hypothetical protein
MEIVSSYVAIRVKVHAQRGRPNHSATREERKQPGRAPLRMHDLNGVAQLHPELAAGDVTVQVGIPCFVRFLEARRK